MKFNNFSSTPGRVMVHIGLVLVQWFKRSPCGPVVKLPTVQLDLAHLTWISSVALPAQLVYRSFNQNDKLTDL